MLKNLKVLSKSKKIKFKTLYLFQLNKQRKQINSLSSSLKLKQILITEEKKKAKKKLKLKKSKRRHSFNHLFNNTVDVKREIIAGVYTLKQIKNKNKKFVYQDEKLQWFFQQLSSKLTRAGKKEKIENALFFFYKLSLQKKQQYNVCKFFLSFFFEKLKKYKPLIELSKKSKKAGKKSAKALERLQRRTYNRLIIPNFMSRKKQYSLAITWVSNAVQTAGTNLNEGTQHKENLTGLKSDSNVVQLKKRTLTKNKIKGIQNILKAIKEKKKQKQESLLNKKTRVKLKVCSLQKKLKKLLINIFIKNESKSFLAEKLQLHIHLTGKQHLIGLTRWK